LAAWVALLSLAVVVRPVRADDYPRNPDVDILHYRFELMLDDDSDTIEGRATVDLRFRVAGASSLDLDLIGAASRDDGRGMTVAEVRSGDDRVTHSHDGDRLRLTLAPSREAGERRSVTIVYRGVPAGGLVIGPNKHGDRTFFSDNWPDKARHWLPTVDHPYDKATSELIVTAPSHYQVISNGLMVEESDLADGRRRTHWKQSMPIASWLYVLGAARFAVQHLGVYEGVPVQTWVYPQDREAGFYDFADPTPAALEYYSRRIGSYPYEKLANVQSNSVNGGMEAATALFYSDEAVTGERSVRWRNVIVHEIAHQWWGNAVTERDWDDVWLSEGFATYFTLLFIEHAYGRDEFLAGLRRSRDQVRAFHLKNPDYRVVHDDLSDMSQVTSSQTYQKGGWTLHMLRGLMGDETFWRGIRTYYHAYRDANASTDDFRRVMEEASGLDLATFFRQWLYRGGYLEVEGSWRYDAAARSLEIELRQVQKPGEPFEMPVEVAIYEKADAPPRIERISMTQAVTTARLAVEGEPVRVVLDPHEWVLMESAFERRD
jgi:aminopeptidase N